MESSRYNSQLRFNCKVSSDKNDSERLHQQFNWIPGFNNIRPSRNILYQKYLDSVFMPLIYKSVKDYIYINHFKFNPTLITQSNKTDVKLECLREEIFTACIISNMGDQSDVPPISKSLIILSTLFPNFSSHSSLPSGKGYFHPLL